MTLQHFCIIKHKQKNYVITCWVLPPVNKDGATSEWQKEKMSFLSAVSFIFSVCSPRSLSFTGRRQKSHAGDGKGWKAVAGWAAPMEQNLRTDRGLPRHSACQCPARRQNAWDTPFSFTLDCYHGDALFASTVSQKGCVHRSWNNLFSRTNRHTHNIYRLFGSLE